MEGVVPKGETRAGSWRPCARTGRRGHLEVMGHSQWQMVALPAHHRISTRGQREPDGCRVTGEGVARAAKIRREGWKVYPGPYAVDVRGRTPPWVGEVNDQGLMDVAPVVLQLHTDQSSRHGCRHLVSILVGAQGQTCRGHGSWATGRHGAREDEASEAK
jgi:hypothetical protein